MKKFLLLIFLSSPLLTFGQSGIISGVITYFFNDNFGNRPDVAATVYVFKEKIIPPGGYEYSTLDTFRVVNSYRELERIYKIVDQEMSEEQRQTMKKYGIETEEDLKNLDIRAFTIIHKIKSEAPLKTSVATT